MRTLALPAAGDTRGGSRRARCGPSAGAAQRSCPAYRRARRQRRCHSRAAPGSRAQLGSWRCHRGGCRRPERPAAAGGATFHTAELHIILFPCVGVPFFWCLHAVRQAWQEMSSVQASEGLWSGVTAVSRLALCWLYEETLGLRMPVGCQMVRGWQGRPRSPPMPVQPDGLCCRPPCGRFGWQSPRGTRRWPP